MWNDKKNMELAPDMGVERIEAGDGGVEERVCDGAARVVKDIIIDVLSIFHILITPVTFSYYSYLVEAIGFHKYLAPL
jgi:hypothetical protein